MAENLNGNQISEVKATLDSVNALLVGMKQVKFANEVQTFSCEEEHVDLIDETCFLEKRFADQQRNMSFTRGYEAAQTHEGRVNF